MKKLIAVISLTALILTLAACGVTEEPGAEIPNPEIVERAEEIKEDETEKEAENIPAVADINNDEWEHINSIGFYVVEQGDTEYAVLNFHEQTFDPALFREYFYGRWEFENGHELIISDIKYENSNHMHGDFYTGMVGRVGDIIITDYNAGGVRETVWVDINNPAVMYMNFDYVAGNINTGDVFYRALTKMDKPLEEPQDGFISILMKREIVRDYEIDPDLFYNINLVLEDGRLLYTDERIFGAALYLISEAPEKLVFKGLLFVSQGTNDVEEILLTFEKTDGEWVRTIDAAD
jgi:hypothetical protein